MAINLIFFIIRREGTTTDQDTVAKDDIARDVGSGNEAEISEASQALKLAENLALNPFTLNQQNSKREDVKYQNEKLTGREGEGKSAESQNHEKRTIIPYPDGEKIISNIRNKLNRNNIEVSVKYGDREVSSEVKKRNLDIDDQVLKRVQDDFLLTPKLGMFVKCNIPGNRKTFDGTLRYLGTVNNLPNRSLDIIAGLQLHEDNDLGTDGTFLGKQYFTTEPKRGYFVPFKYCTTERE